MTKIIGVNVRKHDIGPISSVVYKGSVNVNIFARPGCRLRLHHCIYHINSCICQRAEWFKSLNSAHGVILCQQQNLCRGVVTANIAHYSRQIGGILDDCRRYFFGSHLFCKLDRFSRIGNYVQHVAVGCKRLTQHRASCFPNKSQQVISAYCDNYHVGGFDVLSQRGQKRQKIRRSIAVDRRIFKIINRNIKIVAESVAVAGTGISASLQTVAVCYRVTQKQQLFGLVSSSHSYTSYCRNHSQRQKRANYSFHQTKSFQVINDIIHYFD